MAAERVPIPPAGRGTLELLGIVGVRAGMPRLGAGAGHLSLPQGYFPHWDLWFLLPPALERRIHILLVKAFGKVEFGKADPSAPSCKSLPMPCQVRVWILLSFSGSCHNLPESLFISRRCASPAGLPTAHSCRSGIASQNVALVDEDVLDVERHLLGCRELSTPSTGDFGNVVISPEWWRGLVGIGVSHWNACS